MILLVNGLGFRVSRLVFVGALVLIQIRLPRLRSQAVAVYDREVEFASWEFFRSWAWEYAGILWNLPLIWLLGGNRHVASNRWYIPNKQNLGAFYFFGLPLQLLLGAGHIVYILNIEGCQQTIDVSQLVLMHAMVMTRGAVVAIKYAYMSERDLSDNYQPPPMWD